jgi:hypothetical protein
MLMAPLGSGHVRSYHQPMLLQEGVARTSGHVYVYISMVLTETKNVMADAIRRFSWLMLNSRLVMAVRGLLR